MKKGTETLSRRERQILDAIFQRNEATVAEVVAALPDATSYNAIRNLMTLMEKKGYLTHRVDGIRYLYSPTQTTENAAANALQRVVETFFAGSVEQMVTTLLSADEVRLSPEGAERIEALIAAARAKQENPDES